MTARLLRFVVTLIFSVVWTVAHADYSKIQVDMEDGSKKNLTELSWFKFANMSGFMDRQRPFPGSDYWTILAPPKFCPFHFYYWRGPAPGSLQMKCDDFMRKKLSFLPSDIQNVCRCGVILETQKVARGNTEIAIWKSHNDEVINAGAFSIERKLVHNGQAVDVIIRVGDSPGIYDYAGARICNIEAGAEFTADRVVEILRGRDFKQLNLPLSCFGRWTGRINAEGLTYSVLKRKITGSLLIELEGEQSYALEEY